jgi:hypothetical protein
MYRVVAERNMREIVRAPVRHLARNCPSVSISAMDTTTLMGFFAAFCTSVSYFPQLKKCWDTGKAQETCRS